MLPQTGSLQPLLEQLYCPAWSPSMTSVSAMRTGRKMDQSYWRNGMVCSVNALLYIHFTVSILVQCPSQAAPLFGQPYFMCKYGDLVVSHWYLKVDSSLHKETLIYKPLSYLHCVSISQVHRCTRRGGGVLLQQKVHKNMVCTKLLSKSVSWYKRKVCKHIFIFSSSCTTLDTMT